MADNWILINGGGFISQPFSINGISNEERYIEFNNVCMEYLKSIFLNEQFQDFKTITQKNFQQWIERKIQDNSNYLENIMNYCKIICKPNYGYVNHSEIIDDKKVQQIIENNNYYELEDLSKNINLNINVLKQILEKDRGFYSSTGYDCLNKIANHPNCTLQLLEDFVQQKMKSSFSGDFIDIRERLEESSLLKEFSIFIENFGNNPDKYPNLKQFMLQYYCVDETYQNLIDNLSNDNNICVRELCAKNPYASVETLKKLFNDKEYSVRQEVINHPKAEEVLKSLLKDFKQSNFEEITNLSIETLSKKDIKIALNAIYEGLESAKEKGLKLNKELKSHSLAE